MERIEIDAGFKINRRDLVSELKSVEKAVKETNIKPLDISLLPDLKQFKREVAKLRQELIKEELVIPVTTRLNIPKSLNVAVNLDAQLSKQIDIASGNLSKNIVGAIEEGFKKASSGDFIGSLLAPVGIVASGIFGALSSVLSGAVIGLSLPLGQKLGQGLADGIENELGDVIGSFDLVGKKIASGLVDELLTELGSNIKVVKEVFESIIPSQQITTEAAARRFTNAESNRQKVKSAAVQLGAETARISENKEFFRAKELAIAETGEQLKSLAADIQKKIEEFQDSLGLPKLSLKLKRASETLQSQSKLLSKKLAIPEELRSDEDKERISKLNTRILSLVTTIKGINSSIAQIGTLTEDKFASELTSIEVLRNKLNAASAKLEKELSSAADLDSIEPLIREVRQKPTSAQINFSRPVESNLDVPENIQPFTELIDLYREIERAEEELNQKNLIANRIAATKEEFQLEFEVLRNSERRTARLNKLANEINDVVDVKTPEKFRELADLIFRLSDIDAPENLPNLALPGGNLLEQLIGTNTLASFSAKRNSLVVDPDIFDAFTGDLQLSNQKALEGIGLISRELRKQATSGGKELQALKFDELPKTLLKATEKELEIIGGQVERLAASNANKGVDPSVARAIEEDALVFELRLAESIAKKLGFLAKDFDIDRFNRGAQQEITIAANNAYSTIVKTIAKASGLEFSKIENLVPTAILPETEQLNDLISRRATASFDSETNQILLRPGVFEQLANDARKLTAQEIETLAHEIRHSLQVDFGRLNTQDLNAGKFGVPLLKATKEELKIVGAAIERSVASALKNGSQLSEETIRALEEDAYVFQLRTANLIKERTSVALKEVVPDPKQSAGFSTGRLKKETAKKTVEQATEKIEKNINTALAIYQAVFEEVLRVSNADETYRDLIPKLAKFSALKEAKNPNVSGLFDPAVNTISVKGDRFKQLNQGIFDKTFIETLAHEIRHALQLLFGELTDADIKEGLAGVDLLTATEEEFNKLGKLIEGSVKAFAAKGSDPEVGRKLEEDAYVFQERYGEIIYEIIRSRFENIQKNLEKASKRTAQASSSFKDKSSNELISNFNSEEYSSKGLKEVVKRLGISANVYKSASKQELAEVIANQIERGRAEEVEELINSLGDLIKNKKYQKAHASTLPKIDEEAYLARLREASLAIEARIKELKNNPPQTLEELNQELKQLAVALGKEVKTASDTAKNNDLSGSFAAILGGYKGRWLDLFNDINSALSTNLGRNLDEAIAELNKLDPSFKISPEAFESSAIIKKIDSTLSLVSQLDPVEAIEAITKIEPELKEYLASVKQLDKNDETEIIKTVLVEQLKTIKAAKKLALNAVEFDFKELLNNPQEYIGLLGEAQIAKVKQSIATQSIKASNAIVVKTEQVFLNLIEDLKDKLLEGLETIRVKSLPSAKTPLALPGDNPGFKEQAIATASSLIIRALVDTASTAKSTYEQAQILEKFVLGLNPVLGTLKSSIQTAAPVIGGVAIASSNPEVAEAVKFLSQHLAGAIEPLINALRAGAGNALGDVVGQLPGVGGGARAAIQFLLNNSLGSEQLAQATAFLTTYGALGAGTSKAVTGGARLAGQKAIAALPESVQANFTPESVVAFDRLVAQRQIEIKALAGDLNKNIAQIKGSGSEGTQKLLNGYQELSTQIKELETAASNSGFNAFSKISERIKELKGIQKALGKAINAIDRGKQFIADNLFSVEITPADTEKIDKSTLKRAIAEYTKEIVDYRTKLEKKILTNTFVDSDLEAGAELARRGQALADVIGQKRGFSKQTRNLSEASSALSQSSSGLDKNAISAGDDVINGILLGSSKRLAEVLAQGEVLGLSLLQGVKDALDIKSPSGKMSDDVIPDVIAGSEIGVNKNLDRIHKAGEELGNELSKGIKDGIDDPWLDIEDETAPGQGAARYVRSDRINSATDKFTLYSFNNEDNDIPDPWLDNDRPPRSDEPKNTQNQDIDREIEQLKQLENQSVSFFERIFNLINRAKTVFVKDINLTPDLDSAVQDFDEAAANIEVSLSKVDKAVSESERNLNNATDKAESAIAGLDRGTETLVDRIKRIGQQLVNTDVILSRIKQAVVGFVAFRAFNFIENQIDRLLTGIVEAQIKMEQLRTSVNFAAGGGVKGAESLSTIADTSDRLKISLTAATSGYQQLAAASKNTALEGEKTKQIYESIAAASRVNNLSDDNTQGAFLAISQIISKGTVSAEELRGQLGERLPGAFQIAARAMGVTTQELQKLLETGSLTAEDFLPKFVRQLSLETAGGVAGALNTTGAASQNLNNEFLKLQTTIGEGIKPATIATFNTLAAAAKITAGNFGLVKVAIESVIATLLVAAIPSFSALGTAAWKALTGIFTQTQAVNGALIGMARVLKATAVLVAVDAIASSFFHTANAGAEVRQSVESIDKAYQDLLVTLSKKPQGTKTPEELAAELAQANAKKVPENLNYFQKSSDAVTKFLREFDFKLGLDDRENPNFFNFTFEEAELSRISAGIGDVISKSQQVIQKADLDLGLGDLTTVETGDLSAYISTLTTQANELKTTASQVVEPGQLTRVNNELAATEDRLNRYNAELTRRNGLELNLSQIILPRDKKIQQATEAEIAAIAEIENKQIQGAITQETAEKQKLKATLDRTTAQLLAEKTALSQIAALNDDGKGLSTKEKEEYIKSEKEITKLIREQSKLRLQVAESEVKEKIALLEKQQQAAVTIATETEKERLIETQRLINVGAITIEKAEHQKLVATKERIQDELAAEREKLDGLEEITTKSTDVEQKIRESKQKTLDLTLQLLENEKQAQEETVNAILSARSREIEKLDAISSAYERINQIKQSHTELEKSIAGTKTSIAQLEIDKLKRALEIERTLTMEQLETAEERRVLYDELNSLGITGYVNQLDLVDQIADLERNLATDKLTALDKELTAKKASLELEIKIHEIATKKAELEAKNAVLTNEKNVVDAQKLLVGATTPTEQEDAQKILDLSVQQLNVSKESLKLALDAVKTEDEWAKKKREQLDLEQKLARQQLERANNDARLAVDRENAQNEANKIKGTSLDPNAQAARKLELDEALAKDRAKGELSNRGTVSDDNGIILTASDSARYGSGENVVEVFKKWREEDKKNSELRIRSSEFNSEFRIPNSAFTIETPSGFKNGLKDFNFNSISDALRVDTNINKSISDKPNPLLGALNEIKQLLTQRQPITATFNNTYGNDNEKELLRQARSQTYEQLREIFQS